MTRWWHDTLFKRLFLLMWVALVASHIVAFQVVTVQARGEGWPGGPRRGPSIADGPALPSLPPTPGLPGHRPFPPRGDGPDDRMHPMGNGTPTLRLLLDYGIRFLVIGLASWWGARWLSAPMRRLVTASQSLVSSVGGHERLPVLEEDGGTVEVREAAHVFNDMARQLDSQFRNRGLLVAAISHDLRTPLTRMRIRLESLQHEPAVARCVGDVREMNELIDSVLEIFRSDALAEPPRATDALALAQALADDLVEQGHRVTCHGAPTTVLVQPTALRRVLSNLVNNALRYAGEAAVDVRSTPDAVTLVVDDTGPGIAPNLMETVFQPFFSLDARPSASGGGTGLGLFIARDLVQRNGGTLTLANRPEGGLRATVKLPRPR